MSTSGRMRHASFPVANGQFAVTEDRAKPATESRVRALERRLGERLPDDYRRFLLTVNGGRRPGGGWELPGTDGVDSFLGLRDDHHDLAKEVDRVLDPTREPWLPPDAIPIAYALTDNPYAIRYRGRGKGSVWCWDEDWVRVATSFTAFLRKLRQAPDPPGQEDVRRALERDDAKAVRALLDRLPAERLNEPDPATGHTLLQRAVSAGAVKVTRLLLARGGTGIIGLSTANWRGHEKIVSFLLKHGYKPTKADWGSAVGSGSAALVRTYLRLAPAPPKSLLRERLAAARNLLAAKPSADARKIVRMLSRRAGESAKAGR